MRILLIRHARIAGDPYVRPTSPVRGCLSEDVGVPQARALREALAGERIDEALSSPYGRALQTAEIALEGHGVPIRVCDCLREWEPNPELKGSTSTVFEAICARDGQRYAEETWKTELGEGCYDLYARIIPPFLAALADAGFGSRHGGFVPREDARERVVAVFAHGGSLNVILAHLLHVPPFPVGCFAFEEAGVARIDFIERQGVYYPMLRIPRATPGPGTVTQP